MKHKYRFEITEYRREAGLHQTVHIAFLTDIHGVPCRGVLEVLRRRRPDLILITGDLVEGSHPGYWGVNKAAFRQPGADTGKDPYAAFQKSARSVRFLKKCVALAPTFFSLGNHEWVVRDDELDQLRQLGVYVLDDAFMVSPVHQKLWIGGLTSAVVTSYREFCAAHPDGILRSDGKNYVNPYLDKGLFTAPPDTGWLDAFESQEGFRILMCHHPEYWEMAGLSERAIDLVLSGHAHGGQVRIFGQGLYAPGQGILPRYTAGVHYGRHGQMIISRGLSNIAPVPRIANRFELVMLELY